MVFLDEHIHDDSCDHDQSIIKEVLIAVALVVAFFMIREFFCWFFKINHVISAADRISSS